MRRRTLCLLIAVLSLLPALRAEAQNKLESPSAAPLAKPAELPATSTAPADRAAEIEAEITSLKQRIEVLQKELSRLQPRVGNTSPSAPSAKEDGSRVYGSAMEMLRELPVAARPTPKDGWDSFTLPSARDWLDKNVVGNRFESLITVGSIKIRRKFDYELVPGSPLWRAVISAKNEQFKFGSVTLDQDLSGVGEQSFHVDGDELFAKYAEKIVTGSKLKITAKIASIRVTMFGSTAKGKFEIGLTEYEFPADMLRPRKP